MSYQYPPNNQTDFSWVGFDEYTYPEATSSDLAWYNYACQYLISIPTSPNINFSLDKPIEYSAPLATNLEYSTDVYTAPPSPQFSYQVKYAAPSGGQADFYLVCDIQDIETVFGEGNFVIDGIESLSDVIHWDTPWLVSGDAVLSGELTLVAQADYYEGYQIGHSFTWNLPLDIDWTGTYDYTPQSGDNVLVTWNLGVGEFTGTSEIAVTVIATGDNVFTMESSSVIDRGNWGRSNARIRSPIASDGYAEMTPIIMAAVNDIGDMTISSQSGIIIATVFELGQNMQFTDAISHLRGRVIFGYPEANIIRQVYEMSNNRSLVIPNVPEDPGYAVFLTTTDFNLTDEELRRGTIDMTFTFDHDLKDIVKISVWLQSPSGNVSLDKMRIIDYPGGNQDTHILYDPFKFSSQYRIPIHCISKKENQFYIEVEYKNAEISEIDKRSQVMLEKENYVIPFQAHFDNRMPYLNLADHVMLDGPEASSNVYSLLDSTEQITAIYCIPDNDVKDGIDQNANENTWYSQEFDEITRIFCIPDDDLNLIPGPGGANSNTYFIQEYVDLSSGQIGG